MSASTLYLRGLGQWPALDDVDFRWILLDDTYVPDASTDEFVADLTGELTDPSYGRVTLSGSSIAVAATVLGDVVIYTSAAPVFPALAGAVDAAWLVLAREVTNDADSPLLAAWAIAWTPTGSDFTPVVNATFGLHAHTAVTAAFWPAL